MFEWYHALPLAIVAYILGIVSLAAFFRGATAADTSEQILQRPCQVPDEPLPFDAALEDVRVALLDELPPNEQRKHVHHWFLAGSITDEQRQLFLYCSETRR